MLPNTPIGVSSCRQRLFYFKLSLVLKLNSYIGWIAKGTRKIVGPLSPSSKYLGSSFPVVTFQSDRIQKRLSQLLSSIFTLSYIYVFKDSEFEISVLSYPKTFIYHDIMSPNDKNILAVQSHFR